MSKLRIVLADDHAILRQGIKSLLGETGRYEVVGEASDGLEAVKLAASLRPDVLVMDVALPVINGVDATRRILARSRNCRVVALSMHAEPQFVAEMMRAGAGAYVLKDSAFDELCTAVEMVVAGRTYISPAIAGDVVMNFVMGETYTSPVFSKLTQRERECLQLIAEGKSTSDIAEIMHISVKTVETHKKNLMDKLGTRSIAELTKLSIREGLTTLDR